MSSFAEKIMDHAVRQPSAPALGWHGRWVSYAELADLTRQAGVRTEQWGPGPVAVVSKKSPETLALVLACVLAGRPVLLPSPDLGRRALDLLVDQVGCQRVATVTGAGIESRAVQGPDPHPVGATARFLLTTSGSTGVPKIVPLPAEATERFVRWATARFGLGPGVTVLNYAPLNFDLCLLDIWATLGSGGCVALVDSDHAVNPRHLVGLFETSEIHVVQAVPMFFRILTEAAGTARYPGVRHLILTGDHTPRRLRSLLPERFPHARFHNIYGCTETNDSFLHSFDAATAAGREVLPLGRPLPGVVARVVTDGVDLVGPGSGELWVSTPFQTPGYLHGGEERFVREPDGRTYFRTGDMVRREQDGELSLVGRTDFQVKVRGVRVNIEEVERVISEHADVAEVGVVAIPDAMAGNQLHAVVRRGSGRLTGLRLRQHCAARLARAAIPSTIHIVDTPLPMTSTGKVNRNRIREELGTGRP